MRPYPNIRKKSNTWTKEITEIKEMGKDKKDT